MIPEEELRQMYCNEKMMATDIGDLVGVSYVTILRWMKKYGIAPRTSSKSKSINTPDLSIDELRRMYCDEKMSVNKISNILGVPDGTISRWMHGYGIELRTDSESHLGNLVKLSKEELYTMYSDEKMSAVEISEAVGVSQSTVKKWMRKYGIESRTISESLIGRTGEKSSAWRGGISDIRYCYKFNNAFKEAVRERDDYTCQLCQFEQIPNGRKLSIHHVHYDKENCYPDVVALCHSCHSKVNGRRDYWEEYFENQLIERGLYCWSLS